MARIKKEDHARILQMVDVERRAVREIATEFGCTAANIYSLLAKLRRVPAASGEAAGAGVTEEEAGAPEAVPAQPVLGLEPQPASVDSVAPAPAPAPSATEPVADKPSAPTLAIVPSAPRPVASPPAWPERTAAEPTPMPERRPTVGARLSKPGMGLVMRTEDGEETMTPFRSIDDLLSAIKPILRASARSQDAVWFSLQSVDLSAIEVDAA